MALTKMDKIEFIKTAFQYQAFMEALPDTAVDTVYDRAILFLKNIRKAELEKEIVSKQAELNTLI